MKTGALLAAVILSLAMCGGALAATITWTGGGSVDNTDWFEAANWDLNRIPTAGDDVVINPPQGSAWHVHLTNSTPHLASLLVRHQSPVNSSGYKTWLTCYNWNTKIEAEAITIGKGGIVTCGGPFLASEMSNRVWIVGNNLTFDESSENFAGRIDVDCKGYRDRPALLDSVSEPTSPGCGRLKGDSAAAYAGGGAVRIELTGELYLTYAKNRITACCSQADAHGNGDGGSVYVSCRTLRGPGFIDASSRDRNGQNAVATKGGSGGRIAIHYDTEAQSALMPQTTIVRARPCAQTYLYAKPFSSSVTGMSVSVGDWGTIWFPDRQFLEQDTIYCAGIWHFGNGSVASLDWDGNRELRGYLEFPDAAPFRIRGNLNINGEKDSLFGLRTQSGLTVDGNLSMNGATIYLDQCDLTVGGDLMLTNKTSYPNCCSYGGFLHAIPRSVGSGEVGSQISVGGTFTVSHGSIYQPEANATDGSVCKVSARDVNFAEGSFVFADKCGYAATKGPGGYSGSDGHSGASYGGVGAYVGDNLIPVYGSAKHPTVPGSGASYAGGGAVIIEAARTMSVNGLITASSNLSEQNSYWGGGSGGAIYLTCSTLYGTTGQLLAQGGKGGGSWGSCAGGGGRISVLYRVDASSGLRENCTAPAGEQGATLSGMISATAGTVNWQRLGGAMIILR